MTNMYDVQLPPKARDCGGITVRRWSTASSCDAREANLDGAFPPSMAEATEAQATRAIDPPQGPVPVADATPSLVRV